MNIFRFAGDMTHLISILVLLLKIYATKSCSGNFTWVIFNCALVFLKNISVRFQKRKLKICFSFLVLELIISLLFFHLLKRELRVSWVSKNELNLFCIYFSFVRFRDFVENSRALCTGLFDAVLGSLHRLYLRVQHCDEASIHCQFSRDCLVHEDARSCSSYL